MNVRTSNCEFNEVLSSNITGEVSTHSNCCERLADVNFVNWLVFESVDLHDLLHIYSCHRSTVIPSTVIFFWNPKKYQLLSVTPNRNCIESDIRHPTSADGFHKPAMNHCFFTCSLRGFVSQLWLPLSRRYQGVAQGLQWYDGACGTGTLLQIPPAFWSGEPELTPRNWTWDKSSQTFPTTHAWKSNSRNPDA